MGVCKGCTTASVSLLPAALCCYCHRDQGWQMVGMFMGEKSTHTRSETTCCCVTCQNRARTTLGKCELTRAELTALGLEVWCFQLLSHSRTPGLAHFFCFCFLGHIWWCLGYSCLVLRGHSWWCSGNSGILGVKPGLASCKVKIPPRTSLLSGPRNYSFSKPMGSTGNDCPRG